MMNIRIIT